MCQVPDNKIETSQVVEDERGVFSAMCRQVDDVVDEEALQHLIVFCDVRNDDIVRRGQEQRLEHRPDDP